MIKWIKSRSEFNLNVLTLMLGTTITQAIPIAITPILTRIYTPEEFGVLALFVAITVVFGSISNGRYELAIMLPEKDEDAINVAALALLIALFISIAMLVPAIFLNAQITNLLGNQEIGFWLYFVPFVVFMAGLFNVLNFLNTRKKLYKDIAKANVYKATAMASVQLGVGFIKTGAIGLLTGQIISQIVANYRLAKNTKQNYDLNQIKKTEIKRLGKRYIDFPKYSMWAVLLNTSSTHLVNILISLIYGVTSLGAYSLVQRVLGVPSSIIGSSISQVFFQQASNEIKRKGNCRQTFRSTLKKLVLICLLIFIPLYFVVEELFSIVFGEDWRVAGTYAKVLMIFFAMRFVSSSLSIIVSVYELNFYSLIINLIIMLLSFILLYYSTSFDNFLHYFSINMSTIYFILIFVYFRISKNGKIF